MGVNLKTVIAALRKIIGKDTTPKLPPSIKSYIDGSGSPIDLKNKEVKEYRKWVTTKLAGPVKAYRGFGYPDTPEDVRSDLFEGLNIGLSFTEDRNTAIPIAKNRASEGDEFGYVISTVVPPVIN